MKQMLLDSVYFGVLLTLGAYAIGMMLKRKLGWSILNPLLVAIILIIEEYIELTARSRASLNDK